MPWLTQFHRSSSVWVMTEMLYAMFQAWKTHTRGNRGCNRVMALASSTASKYLPASFMSLARIHRKLTKIPRNAPMAMPAETSHPCPSSARSVWTSFSRPCRAASVVVRPIDEATKKKSAANAPIWTLVSRVMEGALLRERARKRRR